MGCVAMGQQNDLIYPETLGIPSPSPSGGLWELRPWCTVPSVLGRAGPEKGQGNQELTIALSQELPKFAGTT